MDEEMKDKRDVEMRKEEEKGEQSQEQSHSHPPRPLPRDPSVLSRARECMRLQLMAMESPTFELNQKATETASTSTSAFEDHEMGETPKTTQQPTLRRAATFTVRDGNQ